MKQHAILHILHWMLESNNSDAVQFACHELSKHILNGEISDVNFKIKHRLGDYESVECQCLRLIQDTWKTLSVAMIKPQTQIESVESPSAQL